MARTSKVLNKEVVRIAEHNLEELGKTGAVAIKLKAVLAAHKHGITHVAEVFNTTKATLISWIKHVKENAIERLKVQEGRGGHSVLTPEAREIIRKQMTKDSQITIDKVRHKIITELGIEIGRSTVHRAMKELGFSYITPRP